VTFVGASFSFNAACTAGGRVGRNDQESLKYALSQPRPIAPNGR
jgi:hypothetical protein